MRYLALAIAFLLALSPVSALAASDPLPVPSCGPGWALDGKVAAYDKETLSERIDGEAELYFPYGFERLSYGRYVHGGKALDLDVYRMGSPLDAFGIYSGYRPDGADRLDVGSGGAVTPAQLFFYQERYFVRLQSTGEPDAGKAALAACARAVSSLLPAGGAAPAELDLLAIPEIEQESVRYVATSLLGYDFLPKGLVADATVAGKPARVFVVLAGTAKDAAKVLAAYRDYLRQNGGELKKATAGGAMLAGTDPMYGTVLAEQAGGFLFGMVRVKDVAASAPVMEKLRQRLGR